MKNLNLRQLQVFETAATTGSHAEAAETLGLSQPAVSMHLRQLEAELGAALFVGRGRTRQLTESGAELLRHARVILAQVQAAEASLAAMQGSSTRGLLHLGVVPTANYFAPLLMMAFRQRFPDVTLRLTVDRRDAILALLQEHRIDLAIGGYPPSEADVEAEGFARHPHCIVAPADHPLTTRRKLQWADLNDEPFIFRERGSATRQFLEHLLASQSLRVKVGIELAGNETVKQAVMAGMGLTFMSAHAFQTELAAGRIGVLDLQGMPKELDWCVLQRRDSVLSGVTAAFREFVLAEGAAMIACKVRPD
jgi:DNA-binding transcriptional LysR family regulator